MKKKQDVKEHVSPFADQVMQLGSECGYRPLQVNSSLLIGEGRHGWHAYAVLAAERRIGEIKQALERQHYDPAHSNL